MQNQYDVIIAGGGLAGLTLSIQLKQANPTISILILEKNKMITLSRIYRKKARIF